MAETNTKSSWLNRTVLGVGLTSLFSDWSHETATAVLPAFLALIGAGPAWLGVIEGVADGLSSFTKLAAGHFTDRLKTRKPLAVFGYAVTAFATASFGLATAAFEVMLGRTLAWFGRGVRSPAKKALLAADVPPGAYGRAFGFERLMDTCGAIAGPLTALWLLEQTRQSYRQVFLWTLVPGLTAVVVFWLFVRERPVEARPRAIIHCRIEIAASSLSAIFSGGRSIRRGRFFAHDVDSVCVARAGAGARSGSRGEHRGWAVYVAQRVLCRLGVCERMDQRSCARAEICFGGGIWACVGDGDAFVHEYAIARVARRDRCACWTLRWDRGSAGRFGRGGIGGEGSAWDGVWDAGGGECGRRFFVERARRIFVERVFGAGGVWHVGGFIFGWYGNGFAAATLNDCAGTACRADTILQFPSSTRRNLAVYALSSPSNI